MTDFFTLSDGKSSSSENGSFEASTKMENIPDNTDVMANIDEAKWDQDFHRNECVNIRWNVLEPKEYSGRKLFQKIYLTDSKPNSKDPIADKDKAKKMLMAIDYNAGGNIQKAGVMPTDESLTRFLVNSMMVLKVMEWVMEVDGQEKSGNWIAAVSSKKKQTSAPSEPAKTYESSDSDGFSDDIPF